MAAGVTITKLNIEIEASAAKAKSGISAVDASLGRLSGSSLGAKKGLTGISTSMTMLAAKAAIVFIALKRVAATIAGWIRESNAYQENLNLFTVAMGKYANEAKAYADTVSAAMGIDPSAWMRNEGIFMTLISGFGNTEEAAYKMSKNLTQLGYDLSSFFNISVADSMQKLQSGMAGELEPLRRLGYDLSQTKLQQIAFNNGINQSVASMNQAQKAQLRYVAIMTQVTKAQGDMSRTLESPANQLRILQAAATQAARALGNMFIPALNAVLPYAIAFLNVIRTVANSLATLFGFQLTTVDYSGLDGATSSMEDLESATSGAGGAAKALKNYLMGIDELNVIQPDAGGGGGGGGGISGGGFGNLQLPEYTFMDVISDKVKQIEDKIKAFFTFLDSSKTMKDFKAAWDDLKTGIEDVFFWINKIMNSEDMKKIMGGLVTFALEGVSTALSLIGQSLQMISDLLAGDGESALSHYGLYWAKLWKGVRDYFWTIVYGIIAAFMGLEKNVLEVMVRINDAIGNKRGADELRGMIDSLDVRIANMNDQYELQLSIDQQKYDKVASMMDDLHKPQVMDLSINVKYTRNKFNQNVVLPELAANGGVFNEGQMFIAREAGPEYVGGFGSKTAVVNNDQIVEAVSQGVANAVSAVMGGQSSGDDRPIIVQIDGRQILMATRAAEKAYGYQMSSSTVPR